MRAVKDALWHNSINIAELFGRDKVEMLITVEVGVQDPDALDTLRIAEVFPYGQVTVVPRHGGLNVPRSDGGKPTVIANVAISVALDLAAVR